jgi:hypothetical protein
MLRAALLTVLLLALGAISALPATAALIADPEMQRRLVLWGLPLAAMLLSFLLFPRLLRPAEVVAARPGRRLLLLSACLVALLIDQSFLAVGYFAHWATFTFSPGAATAGGHLAVTALWALPACLFLAIWGWERALRGALYTGWRRRLPAPAALAVSIVTGGVLALPILFPRGEVPDKAFVAATLAAILCRELCFSLLFRNGGGLLVAGLYRGALLFIEAFVVTDWYGLFAPSFNYVTGGPLFYVVRTAGALLAAGVIVWVTQASPLLSIERIDRSEMKSG